MIRLVVALLAAGTALSVAADPVFNTHPRLFLSAAEKTRLLAKKNANDPSWVALQARADTLATYSINPFKTATSSSSPPNTIYYTYQGEGWLYAAMPLALAYQMTGDTKYSNKLIQLAEEMIRAESDPENAAMKPVQADSYYASRAVCPTIAIIYDFCYDQLSSALKAQMVALMNTYFDDVAVNGYQAQNFSYAADGNYFGGHLHGIALMGYATAGDNVRAGEMIEWARIRFDGTVGSVPLDRRPENWRTQCFEGGMRPAVAMDYNGPAISGAPFRGGFDFQAWSYGSEEFGRMIEYMLVVKSATGEDLITPRMHWFSQILRAAKQALFPNRFLIDPTGDWGGNQGAVISRGLPTQLAYILAGTTDGPGAQQFAYSGIAASNIPGVEVFAAPEWVDFVFGDPARTSAELVLPPYYTGFGPSYPQGAPAPAGTNGAIPYFIMRSDWGSSATWASTQMGSQWWDDHQHFAAGHFIIARGGDYLLVSASDWKTELDNEGNPLYGTSGVVGGSLQRRQSCLNNTLFFNDFGTFQGTDEARCGGQNAVGIDEVVAAELTTGFSYVRSDLSTAYNRAGDPEDTANRKLQHFYRNFVYLRPANVFVVFDQVAAKTSSHVRGPFLKHLRWFFPENPTIAGSIARVDHGQSRLFVNTVLPANASLTAVNAWTNYDQCELNCDSDPWGAMNSATFRLEVREPNNPLSVDFLTVFQPGSNSSAAPVTTSLATLDNKMTGVDITQSSGTRNVVFFNSQGGQVPAAVTSTSYNFPGAGMVTHTLAGMVPGATYAVSISGGVVSVTQNPAGNQTASASGVLQFRLASTGEQSPNVPAGLAANAVSASQVNLSWTAPSGAASYEIDRNFVQIATSPNNAFSDTTASANQSYIYRVRAVNASGTSGNSAPAIATTIVFADDPLVAGTPIRGQHVTQLRSAINGVRSLAQLGSATFTDPSLSGTSVKSVHVTSLRSALNAALTALGLAPAAVTHSAAAGTPVRAIDIQELRTGVQ